MKHKWTAAWFIFVAVAFCIIAIVQYFYWKKVNIYTWCESSVLEKELGLAPEQKKQIESLDKSFESDIGKVCKELHNKRKALNAALLNEPPSTNMLAGRKGSAPQTNEKEIDSIISEISGLQGSLEKRVALHLLKIKQVLTPAQQKNFFSMIEEEMCKCKQNRRAE